MKKLGFSLPILTLSFLTLFASRASAQLNRTWVSGSTGSDANACSRTAPCLTFGGAYGKTNAGGEIDCVDAGDFGIVTIAKSITIDCGGTLGSIFVPSGNSSTGISITANAASDIVTIRNLSIVGPSGANAGIQYQAAAAVHLENITVSGPLYCVATGTGSTVAQLTIENSTLSNCGSGVIIGTSGPNAVVDIHKSRITNCNVGIFAANGARVNARESVISANQYGIYQVANGTAGSSVLVTGCTLASNGTALRSASGEFIGASENIFANNATVYEQNGGQIYTGNDNTLWANGVTGATTGGLPKG